MTEQVETKRKPRREPASAGHPTLAMIYRVIQHGRRPTPTTKEQRMANFDALDIDP